MLKKRVKFQNEKSNYSHFLFNNNKKVHFTLTIKNLHNLDNIILLESWPFLARPQLFPPGYNGIHKIVKKEGRIRAVPNRREKRGEKKKGRLHSSGGLARVHASFGQTQCTTSSPPRIRKYNSPKFYIYVKAAGNEDISVQPAPIYGFLRDNLHFTLTVDFVRLINVRLLQSIILLPVTRKSYNQSFNNGV